MTSSPGSFRAAWLLARKDLLLEARSPELVAEDLHRVEINLDD